MRLLWHECLGMASMQVTALGHANSKCKAFFLMTAVCKQDEDLASRTTQLAPKAEIAAA